MDRKTGLKRTAGLRRGKPLARKGKGGKAREKACRQVLRDYFAAFTPPPCQACTEPLKRSEATAHHKVLRSEHGKDTPDNMLILHKDCHAWLHNFSMGKTGGEAARRRLDIARESPAHAGNGLRVFGEAMSDEIQEMRPACQVCLDSGVVQMTDGELRKCPRGCPQPEDQHHPMRKEGER